MHAARRDVGCVMHLHTVDSVAVSAQASAGVSAVEGLAWAALLRLLDRKNPGNRD